MAPKNRRSTPTNEPGQVMCRVLVADDSMDDRVLLKLAMRRAPRLQLAGEVADGVEVIEYLTGRGDFADRKLNPVPNLLLLDLKMPRKDGFEVLTWLKKHSPLDLMVVALTESMRPDDIKLALDLGADLFQVKPHSQRDCEAMMQALEDRWFARHPFLAAQTTSYQSTAVK